MMKTDPRFARIALLLTFVVFFMACGLPAIEVEPNGLQGDGTTQTIPSLEPATDPPEQQPTSTLASSQSVEIINTPTAVPVSTVGPQCKVLQDLFMREGPGTYYDPPITALPPNTVIIPLGYNPVGIPGGSWVQVQDPASQKKGWVSAGSAYVTCNLDLTSLPQVVVAPPRKPTPPDVGSSNEDGTCGAGGITDESTGAVYDCAVVLSDNGLIQFIILKDGQEIGEADGVLNVIFSADQNGNTIYSHTENNKPYCIFGGDSTCNSWVFEDNVYKWEQGGLPVEAGVYTVSISPNLDGLILNLFWTADITVTLP